MMKCVNIWKTCLFWWTNSFQMINASCYKNMHRQKIYSKCKLDQWILKEQKINSSLMWFQNSPSTYPLHNYNLSNFGVISKNNTHNYQKKILIYSSLFQWCIGMRPDVPHTLQPHDNRLNASQIRESSWLLLYLTTEFSEIQSNGILTPSNFFFCFSPLRSNGFKLTNKYF